jgi:hypothetical protein
MKSRMRSPRLLSLLVPAFFVAEVVIAGQTSAPQATTGSAGKAALPRTANGQPDLQGTWDFRTITPMERPSDLSGKQVLNEQEAAEFEVKNRRNQDVREKSASRLVNGAQSTADVDRAYNDFWWDFGNNVVSTKRTSLVIDPADGRIPPLTPEGQKRAEMRREMRERIAHGPEDRGLGERCILGFNAGPPMFPSAYNNNVQIVQTRDYVVLHNEMVHNARIVPLSAAAAPDAKIPAWNGHSRGRWDGNTLVIETKSFKGETAFQNSTEGLTLVERFTRVSHDTLLYEFTVTDATTWTRPWTAQIPMRLSNEQIYEYACHEANYGMENLLKGARFVEQETAAGKQSSSR